MRYEASIRAYDIMADVYICASLWESGALGAEGESAREHFATTVAGVGESRSREWLKDALVALLETL